MSELILNREQSRRVDVLAVERYGMTGLVLMENAGRGAAEIIRHAYEFRKPREGFVVICCGKGNNGGDGFVVARHLDNARIPVRILLFCDPAKLTGDAAANYEIARRSGLPIEVFAGTELDSARLAKSFKGASLLVDALLGTGAKGVPRPPLDRVIETINDHPAPTIALDIPSGLNCDTGDAAAQTIRATYTITFVARKPAFTNPTAHPFLGHTRVVDIGVPRELFGVLAAESGQGDAPLLAQSMGYDPAYESIREALRTGCSEEAFKAFTCPQCGQRLSLSTHPTRTIFHVSCSIDTTHLSMHDEATHRPTWFEKYATRGWFE